MAINNRRHKWLTEKDFTLIKTLADNGLSYAKITQLTGRSGTTIARVKHSKNLEDYTRQMRAFLQVIKSKKPAKPTPEQGRDVIAYRLTQIKDLLTKILEKIQD